MTFDITLGFSQLQMMRKWFSQHLIFSLLAQVSLELLARKRLGDDGTDGAINEMYMIALKLWTSVFFFKFFRHYSDSSRHNELDVTCVCRCLEKIHMFFLGKVASRTRSAYILVISMLFYHHIIFAFKSLTKTEL